MPRHRHPPVGRIDRAVNVAEEPKGLCAREGRPKTCLAGNECETAMDRCCISTGIETEDTGASRCRSDQIEQQGDRRRLTGTVRAEVAEYFADFDLKVEGIERGGMAVPLGQPLGVNRSHQSLTVRGASGWRPPSTRRPMGRPLVRLRSKARPTSMVNK